jgi:rRNA maturation endonuclease Nob1
MLGTLIKKIRTYQLRRDQCQGRQLNVDDCGGCGSDKKSRKVINENTMLHK